MFRDFSRKLIIFNARKYTLYPLTITSALQASSTLLVPTKLEGLHER